MTLNQTLITQLKLNLNREFEEFFIFEWLSRSLDKGEYPALIVRDPVDTIDNSLTFSIEHHTLKIEIDILLSPSDEQALELREIIPRVKDTFNQTLKEEGLKYPANYLGREIIGEETDYFYIASRLSFEVKYETSKWSE